MSVFITKDGPLFAICLFIVIVKVSIMSVANIFDILTKPAINRHFSGFSSLPRQSSFSFSNLFSRADKSSQWANFAGPKISGTLNAALLQLQEYQESSSTPDISEKLPKLQSLDDILMADSDYVFASMKASFTFGSTESDYGFNRSSGKNYDDVFGLSSLRIQSLLYGSGYAK